MTIALTALAAAFTSAFTPGAAVAGRDVVIVAYGVGASSTITVTGSGALSVTGSDVTASRDLTIAAAGPVSFTSATETDTESGQAKSSGASIGVSVGLGTQPNGQLGTGTPSVNLSVSGSKSRYEGETVTHRESNLAAGGTARVTTPDALALKGATLSGERIEVAAGSLSIESEQDTSTYTSREKSGALNASVSFSGQVSVSGNLGRGKQDGDFASVAEQSGIYAGKEGFDIKVGGATDLVGAVIASEADAPKNRLTTGTLTVSDIANRERYSASSTSISAGIGANLSSRDGTDINTDGSGRPLSGIKTRIGTISATPPVAMGAKGGPSGTSGSAISLGMIDITSGDATSQAVAASISRDTSRANAGALTQEYDDAKRQEIALGFEASHTLTGEVGTFLANRGREADEKRKEYETGFDAQGNALTTEQRLEHRALN